ncbi:glutamate receptor ionotropic, delta-2-like [Panulirus ornatus]|uniref:glutamate receptor ionotropic, delta-2-like n=1 Tax=Panulirus ornatus TaxID=150431 RepID=UPI003A838215
MYSGTLTAALAVTAYEKPIDSLYDLADAHQDGYTIGTIRDTNYETTFKRAKSGIYRDVWQLFNHEDRDKSFVPSTDAGFEMILKHKYVLINAELNSRLKATQRGREKFYFARETFLPQGYGIACSSGSPFKVIFSSILIRLTEVGLVGKWADDEVDKLSKYMSPSSDPGPTAISLQHLQAAFLIMMLGFAISVIGLVMELMIRKSGSTLE